MAVERGANSSPSSAGARSTPVLVPQGEFLGKPDIPLSRPVITVGSRETNRLQLQSSTVSSAHALFVMSAGMMYVTDLASRTGVLVNNKPVKEADLKTGDRVKIGKFLFRYRCPKIDSPSAPAAPPAKLDMGEGPPLEITGKTLLIGRRENCDLPLNDDSAVSTAHAIVFQMDGQWYLRDLGSRTGTHVNGKAIHQQLLEFGHVIQIGAVTMRFEFAGASAESASAAAAPGALSDSAAVLDNWPEIPETDEAAPHVAEPRAQATESAPDELDLADLDLPETDLGLDFSIEPETVDTETGNAEASKAAEASTADIASTPPADAAAPQPSDELPKESSVTTAPDITSPAPLTDLEDMHDLPSVQDEPSSIQNDTSSSATAELDPLSLEDIPTEPIFTPRRGWRSHLQVEPALDEESSREQPLDEQAASLDAADEIPLETQPSADETEPATEPPVVEDRANEEPADFNLVETEPAAPQPTAIESVDTPVESTEAIPLADEGKSVEPISPASDALIFEEPPAIGAESLSDPLSSEIEPALGEPAAPPSKDDEPGKPADSKAKIRKSRRKKSDSTEAKPKRARRRKGSEPTDVPPIPPVAESLATGATEIAGVEIIEQTEPTVESALDFAPTAEPAEVEPTPELSDTTFGRAIEEFTGPSTGPIVETPAPQSQASPETQALAPDAISSETAAAHPLDLRESEQTESEQAESEQPVASVESSLAPIDLAELGELEEFVAVPEDEDSLAIEGWDEPARNEIPVEESTETPAPAEEPVTDDAPLSDVPSATEPPVEESTAASEEAEALIEAESPAAAPTTATPETEAPFDSSAAEESEPAVENHASADTDSTLLTDEPAATDSSAAAAQRDMPSIFGFEFEGGSFLGGMPLRLPDPPPMFGKMGYTFDDKPSSFAGAGSTLSPSPAPLTPEELPSESLLDTEEPSTPSAAPSISQRPRGRSLTSLGTEPAIPSIPPTARRMAPTTLADEMAIPPLAGSTAAAPPARQPLTTAFDGLTTGTTTRNADVFSQMAAPITINPEVFGSRSGNVDEFNVPDIKESPPASSGSIGQKNPAVKRSATAPVPQAAPPAVPPGTRRPTRRWRIPFLLLMMVLLLAATWAGAYLYLPLTTPVTGTQAFDKLNQQPMSDQLAFQTSQLARLHSDDVRMRAHDQLIAQHLPLGFLDNVRDFEAALHDDRVNPATGGASNNVRWKEDGTLEISYAASDAAAGRAQIGALLTALNEKDADLIDSLNRARGEAADAQAAVVKLGLQIDDFKSRNATLHKIGEDERPDASLLLKLQTEARRQSILRDAAHAATVATAAAMQGLQTADITKSASPDTDPELVQLRQQLQKLNDQIGWVKASAAGEVEGAMPSDGTSHPADPDLIDQLQSQVDATSARIGQRVAAVQADMAVSPQRRAANRDKEVEDLSVQLTGLQQAETTATAAADHAAQQLQDANDQLARSRQATTKLNDLINQQQATEILLQQKSTEQAAKEAAVARCVTPAGKPTISSGQATDTRPVYAGITSGVILLIFCLMIVSATRTVPTPLEPTVHPSSRDNTFPPPVSQTDVEAARKVLPI